VCVCVCACACTACPPLQTRENCGLCWSAGTARLVESHFVAMCHNWLRKSLVAPEYVTYDAGGLGSILRNMALYAG
jgi:hypothetical protein